MWGVGFNGQNELDSQDFREDLHRSHLGLIYQLCSINLLLKLFRKQDVPNLRDKTCSRFLPPSSLSASWWRQKPEGKAISLNRAALISPVMATWVKTKALVRPSTCFGRLQEPDDLRVLSSECFGVTIWHQKRECAFLILLNLVKALYSTIIHFTFWKPQLPIFIFILIFFLLWMHFFMNWPFDCAVQKLYFFQDKYPTVLFHQSIKRRWGVFFLQN